MATTLNIQTLYLVTSAFLLVTVERVSCDDMTVGDDPIGRPMWDAGLGSGVIIPKPFDAIEGGGIIHRWSAYMGNMDGCVRLQAWRPIRSYTLTTPPSRPGTTRAPLSRTYWRLVGETECIISERANETVHVEIPPKQTIRVEKGDVIGFRYDTSNPIPYDVNAQCEAVERSLEISLPNLADRRELKSETLYGFRALPDCRQYSFKADIMRSNCIRLQADEQIRNYTYTSRNNYEDQCWLIQGLYNTARRTIVTYLQIEELSIPDSADCKNGYLEIREGQSSTAPYLRRDCSMVSGTALKPITSGRVYLRLRRMGGPSSPVTLSLRYSTNRGLLGKACTQVVVTQEPSYIQSPSFPRHYPENADFCWQLAIPQGENRIRVEVPSGLDLQPPVGCFKSPDYNSCTYRNCRDFIEIRDGAKTSSPLLAKWCDHTGNDLVETSSGQGMTINFLSDGTIQGTGFRMKVFAVHPESVYCTHRISSETHNSLHSAHYPHGYPSDRDDCWSIRTFDYRERILVTVQDSALEAEAKCENDWVEIRDGPGRTASLLRRWCGKTVPTQILTSGPNVFIRFVSNSRFQDSGFSIEYKQVKSEACTTYYAYSFSQPLELASDIKESGIDVRCVIIRSEYDRVQLLWDAESDTLGSSICGNNFIEISDGESQSSPSLGRYCSSVPIASQGIASTGNAIYINYVSDPNARHASMKISYRSLSTGHCLTLLASASQPLIFTTPLLSGTTTSRPSRGRDSVSPSIDKTKPDPIIPCRSCSYAPNEEWCWIVETKRGIGKLLFEFRFLELQHADQRGRCSDYIEIFDGKTPVKDSFGRKCGVQLPFNITSSGPTALISFKSDAKIQFRGYRIYASAIYEDKCSQLTVRHYRLQLQSPDFPSSYPTNIERCWLIEGPTDKNPIQLKATQLSLGVDDKIEIYDGSGKDRYLLAEWDDKTPEETRVRSNGRQLRVVFRSGPVSIGLNRFNLDYQWIYSDFCHFVSLGNDNYSPNTSTITNKGYGTSGYQSNEFICWVVTAVLPHHQIRVYSEDFQLQDSQKCLADYLEIYDGSSTDDPFLRRWCGQFGQRLLTHSTGRNLYIMFSSDDSNNYKGFKLKLTTYDTGPTGQTERSTNDGGASGGGLDLTKRDLALIIIILIVLLVVILVVVLAVKCRRKKVTTAQAAIREQPTIIYTNQPPAYPGPAGAVGGLHMEENKEPLPPDIPEQDDNTTNDLSSETPPPTPTESTYRDNNTLLQEA